MIEATPPLRRGTLLRAAALLAAGLAIAVAAMSLWFGAARTAASLGRGLPALPAAIAINLLQLAVCGWGWGALLEARPPAWQMFRARWIREAVNSLFPVASLGGSVVAARLLSRGRRISAAAAAASAAADITGEAIAQFGFLAAALMLAGTLPHARIHPAPILLLMAAAAAGLIGLQAAGLGAPAGRLARRLLPPRATVALRGVSRRLRAIYADLPGMAADIAANFAGWCLGAAEVWVLLAALGHGVTWRAATAIEGLAIVARSLGFVIPAGIGAQEAGIVLAGGLFGVPHEPALALAVLKRLREVMVGTLGVGYWQWLEWRPHHTCPDRTFPDLT